MQSEMKSENEVKKEYLSRYGKALQAEKVIQEEIQQLRLDKMCPSIMQDGMPHGNAGSGDLSGYMAKMDELLEDLKQQMEKRLQIMKGIIRDIERMKNETEKTVLRLRYIHLLKWEEIALKMGYSWKQIHRIHGKALKNFKMT